MVLRCYVTQLAETECLNLAQRNVAILRRSLYSSLKSEQKIKPFVNHYCHIGLCDTDIADYKSLQKEKQTLLTTINIAATDRVQATRRNNTPGGQQNNNEIIDQVFNCVAHPKKLAGILQMRGERGNIKKFNCIRPANSFVQKHRILTWEWARSYYSIIHRINKINIWI